MKLTLSKIAEHIKGKLGSGCNIEITGVSGLKKAKAGDITFVSHKRFAAYIEESKASAFILPQGINTKRPAIIVKNPYLAFARVLELFFPVSHEYFGIDKNSFIGKDVNLSSRVSIYPNVYIGDGVSIGDSTVIFPGVFIGRGCRIGNNVTIHANVSIYEYVTINSRVIIHSGSVIGSDGFGFTKDEDDRYYKIPQVGSVTIEEDVEIGSNVCIDRATLGSTIVRRGVKIDNLVQLAHNVSVGDDSVIAAQTGISGSCTIGKNVMMAGQVGLADHIEITENTILVAQTGVARTIDKQGIYSGSPAMEHNRWKRANLILPKLPELLKRVKKLEQEIKDIKGKV